MSKISKIREIPRQQLHYVSIALNTTYVYCCYRVVVMAFVPQFTLIDTNQEEEEPGMLLLVPGRLMLLLLSIYIAVLLCPY